MLRSLLLAATRETKANGENPQVEPGCEGDDESTPALPAPDSEDEEVWHDLIDGLMDRVLRADRYYDVEEYFLDTDPTVSREMKLHFHIDEDYFAAIAPDPSGKQLAAI